jgi:hypothetical protein
MPKLRHPVSGAIYDLEGDGLIRVETPTAASAGSTPTRAGTAAS